MLRYNCHEAVTEIMERSRFSRPCTRLPFNNVFWHCLCCSEASRSPACSTAQQSAARQLSLACTGSNVRWNSSTAIYIQLSTFIIWFTSTCNTRQATVSLPVTRSNSRASAESCCEGGVGDDVMERCDRCLSVASSAVSSYGVDWSALYCCSSFSISTIWSAR